MKHDNMVQLSYWGYMMYCEMVNKSFFYNVTMVDGGHTIQYVGSDAPPCVIWSG